MLKFLKNQILRINLIVVIALLLIHFVLKENNYFFSLLYYTLPLPLIIIAVVLFSIFQSKKIRTYNLILALVLSVIWFGRSFKINTSEAIKETDIEVVFWNATHKREFKDVFDEVETLPDVVVLVEYHAEELAETKLNYPDFFFYWHSESEIGIFSKMTIDIKEVVLSEDETVVINFFTNGINFYAIDVASSMNVYRKQQLKFVTESIKVIENTILLGDFNTPLESKFLNDIRTNFNQVLTEKGNGFRETWFWNIPLLSLDHIWVSKDLEIIKAEKISTFKSDHSMVKAVIRK
ncbi:endonuclease/exonuclease/phosphatase family protein [uncultured Algibacter sp.]|uniref:endonuclease/exonuclease/phosphatase family protein n=1 Tax=uncultured Algibacter sp. TaxID=298659 RepID=UPI0030EBE901|tara:strand:- start:2717 stop:3595 length:879 start_codon:yes stop_codon:yes gene_type:complete